jgi:type VI secretion system ImpM family protein
MRASPSPASLVGWHGKLPTVGDFATRRLDPSFVSVWDDWLSGGLAKLRRQDESGWLDAYLASPTWRFLLTPGFLPSPLQRQAWAGIVMPSMDRVGRYYPLTIAMALDNLPLQSAEQASLWTWLHRIDDAAVDALQDDWTIDALEAELARIGGPAWLDGAEGAAASDAAMVVVGAVGVVGEADGGAASRFFSVCDAPTRSVASFGACAWCSESGLLPTREFRSQARDDSILELWRA